MSDIFPCGGQGWLIPSIRLEEVDTKNSWRASLQSKQSGWKCWDLGISGESKKEKEDEREMEIGLKYGEMEVMGSFISQLEGWLTLKNVGVKILTSVSLTV